MPRHSRNPQIYSTCWQKGMVFKGSVARVLVLHSLVFAQASRFVVEMGKRLADKTGVMTHDSYFVEPFVFPELLARTFLPTAARPPCSPHGS